MEKKLVSIIIPIYNVEEYIEECLLSVFKQTYKKIEIILIDDRGNDKSIDVARKALDNSPFIYNLITQKNNSGVSEARNTGIKVSRGEYIFFLDGDDLLTSNCIEVLTSSLEESSADVSIGNFKSIHSKDYSNALENAISERNIPNYSYAEIAFNQVKDYSCNAIIKKNLIVDNEIYFEKDIKFAEDTIWIMHIQFKSKKTIVVDYETYYYRIRLDSSSVRLKKTSSYINSLIILINRLYMYYKSNRFNENEKGVLISRIRTFKNGIYSSMLLDSIEKDEVSYKELKNVRFTFIEILKAKMNLISKNIELILAIAPIIDSYYGYKYMFKIKEIISRGY